MMVRLRRVMRSIHSLFTVTVTTELYTLSLHDALPILATVTERLGLPTIGSTTAHLMTHKVGMRRTLAEAGVRRMPTDRKSTRLNSSHTVNSYAVFCLKKKKKNKHHQEIEQTQQTLRRN